MCGCLQSNRLSLQSTPRRAPSSKSPLRNLFPGVNSWNTPRLDNIDVAMNTESGPSSSPLCNVLLALLGRPFQLNCELLEHMGSPETPPWPGLQCVAEESAWLQHLPSHVSSQKRPQAPSHLQDGQHTSPNLLTALVLRHPHPKPQPLQEPSSREGADPSLSLPGCVSLLGTGYLQSQSTC